MTQIDSGSTEKNTTPKNEKSAESQNNTNKLEDTKEDKDASKQTSSNVVQLQNTKACNKESCSSSTTLNNDEKGKKRVGIIGYGHLGHFLKIELGKSKKYCLKRVWNRTPDKEEDILPLADLTASNLADIDLVIEVAHPDVVRTYSKLILNHADLFIGSQSALADSQTSDSIQECLRAFPNRSVFVPSGVLWGTHDIKNMADLGILKEVTLMMIRHPSAFNVLGPLKELNDRSKKHGIPVVLYDGPARLLCPYLEQGNVKNTVSSCAISAHSLGFDGTRIKLIADPEMLNWHIVEYEALSANGFKTIVRRQNPAQRGVDAGEAVYFSFLSSVNEAFNKPSGLNIC